MLLAPGKVESLELLPAPTGAANHASRAATTPGVYKNIGWTP